MDSAVAAAVATEFGITSDQAGDKYDAIVSDLATDALRTAHLALVAARQAAAQQGEDAPRRTRAVERISRGDPYTIAFSSAFGGQDAGIAATVASAYALSADLTATLYGNVLDDLARTRIDELYAAAGADTAAQTRANDMHRIQLGDGFAATFADGGGQQQLTVAAI